MKARINAATALIRAHRRLDGFEQYTEALALPGAKRRKLRGTARVAYELLTSLGGRKSGVPLDATDARIPEGAPWPTTGRHLSG